MKLFVFGCSNSALYHTETLEYRQYRDYRNGSFPLTWSEMLSNQLDCELVNYAIPGSSNDSIKMELVKHVREYRKNDIVIIGWTFINRFMWIDRIKNNWVHYQHMHSDKMDISYDTHSEILLHREHNPSNYLIIKEIYEWMDMIDYLSMIIGFKVYYWECDGRIFSNYHMNLGSTGIILNSDYLKFDGRHLLDANDNTIFKYVENNGGKTIRDETKNLVNDLHWGESGHIVVADKFYKHISKEKNKLL